VAMNPNVMIGLMVASGSTAATPVNTSTFNNLAFTGGINVTVPLNSLPAPTNVQLSGVTSSSASLSWTIPSITLPGDINHNGIVDAADFVTWRATDGPQSDYNAWRANFGAVLPVVTGYTIERSSDNVNFQTIGTVAAGISTFTDSTVAGGLKYHYRVRTNGAVGVSIPSESASGTTRGAAVTGLKVYSPATNQLVVQWNDVNGETDYTLQRSTTGSPTDPWTTVGASTITQNTTMYANTTGLSSGTQYFYRVITVDASGNSDISATVSGFTRLSNSSTPTVTISARTASSITLSWNANANLTRYAVYRGQDNSDWLWDLVNENITGTSFTDTGRAALSEYHYRIVGYTAAGAPTQTVNKFGTTDGANPVTSPWVAQDIGTVAAAGATDLTGGTFTIVGGGADIWGTNDAFRYVYMPMSGDGFIQAHISDMKSPVNDFSRAGIQIRETTATNSAQVSLMLHDTWASVRLQSRVKTGTAANPVGTGEITFPSLINPPYWLRLERVGNTITGMISPTGAVGSWTTVGSVNVTMGTNYLIGMALTPRDNNYLYWAKYDNVTTGALAAGAGVALASGQSLLEMPASMLIDSPVTAFASLNTSRASIWAWNQQRRAVLDNALAQFEHRHHGLRHGDSRLDTTVTAALHATLDDGNSEDEGTALSMNDEACRSSSSVESASAGGLQSSLTALAGKARRPWRRI
ncbi:MAG: hypothetical protein WD468_03660, partial [Pirellulales bacterium]